MRILKSVALWLVVSLACATSGIPATPIERREYILAHVHGWVEVSILDTDVPDLRVVDEKEVTFVRPSSCSVDVELDREDFVDSSVYPVGAAAPYEVSTGFRFPAPVGPAKLTFRYSGCDVKDGERSSVSLELPITVQQGSVSEVHFDGTVLVADPLRPDPVVTIDDVYEAVTGRRTPLPE